LIQSTFATGRFIPTVILLCSSLEPNANAYWLNALLSNTALRVRLRAHSKCGRPNIFMMTSVLVLRSAVHSLYRLCVCCVGPGNHYAFQTRTHFSNVHIGTAYHIASSGSASGRLHKTWTVVSHGFGFKITHCIRTSSQMGHVGLLCHVSIVGYKPI